MAPHYFLSSVIIFSLTIFSFGQQSENFDQNYEPIREELKQWDPVRGEWLAGSMEAMAHNKPIPTRPFPENFTPYQMMKMVPAERKNRIEQLSTERREKVESKKEWDRIIRYVRNSNCSPMKGRSYGDPHLITYDGARFSFQTVGEFVLTKSINNNLEVQVRQKPLGDDFSLNSAVAMNVAGDRLCIYASNYPDSDFSTPVRLNGQPINLNGSTYFLPNGGTVRKSNNTFTVYWPTGEVASAEMRKTSNMHFINVGVNILPCSAVDYTGLLGDANGIERDDFNTHGVAPPFSMPDAGFREDDYVNRVRQNYLTKYFADAHRITMQNSLFDYQPGKSTMHYTDRSFPRVYRDFNDISRSRLERSRRLCQKSGVSSRDMNGCIYDNAYLRMEPTREPIVADPTVGTVLRPVVTKKPNVNKPRPTRPSVGQSGNSKDVGSGKTVKEGGQSTTPNSTRPSTPPRTKEPRSTVPRSTMPRTPRPKPPVVRPSRPSRPRTTAPRPSSPKPTPRPSAPKTQVKPR